MTSTSSMSSSKRHKHDVVDSVPSSSSSTITYTAIVINTHASPPSSVVMPTLRSLAPVRSCVQSMLEDEDAARLLRVSRYTATTLLTGYSFHRHAFLAESASHLRRLTSFYSDYSMSITRMRLAAVFNDPLHDVTTGQSL